MKSPASFPTTSDVSIADALLIISINHRAKTELHIREKNKTAIEITVLHFNGTPLRLVELLHAPPVAFAHDIHGIARHLNHDTSKLEGKFHPRYAVSQ